MPPVLADEDDMPDGVLKAILKYGFGTVAAVVLGYFVLIDVKADQTQSQQSHQAIVLEQRNLGAGVLKLADKQGETQMLQEKILGVLRAMCVQQATTAAERRECLRED